MTSICSSDFCGSGDFLHISSTHFACAPFHHLSRVRTRANTQTHTSTHTKNIKLANCNSNSCYTFTKGSFFINVSRTLRFKTGECFTTKPTHKWNAHAAVKKAEAWQRNALKYTRYNFIALCETVKTSFVQLWQRTVKYTVMYCDEPQIRRNG